MTITSHFRTHTNRDLLTNVRHRIVQTVPELMQATGRLIAVSLATSTTPYGVDESARKKGEKAVRRDIALVYASPGRVYRSFPDKRQANSFWRAMIQRNYSKAQQVVNSFSSLYRGVPIRAFDGGAAHQAARNKGKVPAKQKPVMIVQTARNMGAYIAKEVDHVGEAKAGWAACAKALGGTRGLPQWITRHAGKLSPGEVLEHYTGPVFTLRMVNGVRYAQEALSSAEKEVAIRVGIDRFLRGQIGALARGGSVRRD